MAIGITARRRSRCFLLHGAGWNARFVALCPNTMNAWIETSGGDKIGLEGNCYFGRSSVNTVRLQSPGASRRHALIHSQQSDLGTEYWLADLGSTNGTAPSRRGQPLTFVVE